jgi:hypothetical protein
VVAAFEALGGQLELDPQRNQPLLRAVVQVALDAAPLVVRAGLDARARLADLFEQEGGLGAEATGV